MLSLQRHRYGGPEVLSLRETSLPVPGPGEVRVRVRASSVNPAEWIFLTGRPLPVRVVAGWPHPSSPGMGADVAGIVEALGPGVSGLARGDAVFGEARGAWAEQAIARVDRLVQKPASLAWGDAAAAVTAGVTALQALAPLQRRAPGARVLINGASGGVGTFAVQIARAFGAEITAVCRGRNASLVRGLGAAAVVDYEREDFTRGDARFDLVLDLVGSASLDACLRVLAPTGTYVSSVGRTGWSLWAFVRSLLPRSRVRVLAAVPTRADLETLAAMIGSGEIRPAIERSIGLAELPATVAAQGAGRTRGKTIVVVGAPAENERETEASNPRT